MAFPISLQLNLDVQGLRVKSFSASPYSSIEWFITMQQKTAAVAQNELISSSLLHEVLDGLTARPRRLPCKLLYDKKGSELFDQICELPEYYPTRTEVGIMQEAASEIADVLGPRCFLLEFGAGASVKVRLLLDHMHQPAGYVPIDISREHLLNAAQAIAHDYPHLQVCPVPGDYLGPLQLPEPDGDDARKVAFFPGSTIGNFEKHLARQFLRKIAGLVGPDGGLLIGVDLHKDGATLERAYNDQSGITAAFNRNILDVLNNDLGADFQTQQFTHQAVYDQRHQRIEMRLISDRDQCVQLDGQELHFSPGEYIITEYSHKYTLKSFSQLAHSAGMSVEHVWCDPQQYFSVQYLRPSQ